MTRTSSTRLRVKAALAVTSLLGSALAVGAIASTASATTVNYVGSTTGTQSSLIVHRGDQFQRNLNPTGTVTATLDDTNHTVTSQVHLDPTFTPTFVGAFNVKVYVRTDIQALGAANGTATPSATPGIENIAVSSANRLHVTVYQPKADGIQRPDTDIKLTDPAKCYTDLSLSLSGTANRRTGDLSVAQDPFTIPNFSNGTPDPARSCGLTTGVLNNQLAGANNAISLNFSGAPTSAHYTGVSTGNASTIVVQKGNALLERTIHPTGSITADIDFVNGTTSNVTTKFNSTTITALSGVLSFLPAYAKIDLATVGTTSAALTPSGTAGIDNIAVQTTARMGVTVLLGSPTGWKVTNPSTCYVDIALNLHGTVDRGTDQLSLNQDPFTIPRFGSGCGLLLGAGLTLLISGTHNSASLNYVDGVVA